LGRIETVYTAVDLVVDSG